MEDETEEEKKEKTGSIGDKMLEDDLELEADIENLPI